MILDSDLLRLAEKLCLGASEPEWRCAVMGSATGLLVVRSGY